MNDYEPPTHICVAAMVTSSFMLGFLTNTLVRTLEDGSLGLHIVVATCLMLLVFIISAYAFSVSLSIERALAAANALRVSFEKVTQMFSIDEENDNH